MQRYFESRNRSLGCAGVAQRVAAQAHEVAFHGGVFGQFDATLAQGKRPLKMKGDHLRFGRLAIGQGGGRIVGAIEMLRAQDRVGALVPCGSRPVQLRAA